MNHATATAPIESALRTLLGAVDAYSYNARNELTSAHRTKNGQLVLGFSEDFDYDPIGNRQSSATFRRKVARVVQIFGWHTRVGFDSL